MSLRKVDQGSQTAADRAILVGIAFHSLDYWINHDQDNRPDTSNFLAEPRDIGCVKWTLPTIAEGAIDNVNT